MKTASPKVAIVHDWMLLGGAEKVVEQLLTMYPNAPLYTSCISPLWQQKLKDRTVVTGYLNSKFFQKVRKFVPFLRQKWFEGLDFTDYDIVISSSGAEAKGIKVPKGVLHINYCHAPTHYYWSRYEEYLKNPGFGPLNSLARLGLKLLVNPMRKWDYKAAQRPNVIVANSSHIASEIKKYYKRDASVIHPPVDTAAFTLKHSGGRRTGFVIAGRLTPYKRFDLAIAACSQLGLPLSVIGDGPERKNLQAMAGETVMFLGMCPQEKLVEAFQAAQAFIFPGLDDFGITPVEAMAAGCPVIAYKAGGALDYILPGKTGVFFEKQTTDSLANTITEFKKHSFSEKTVAAKASEFSPKQFAQKFDQILQSTYKHHMQQVKREEQQNNEW